MSLRGPEPVDRPLLAGVAAMWSALLVPAPLAVAFVAGGAAALAERGIRRAVSAAVIVGLALGMGSAALVAARAEALDGSGVAPGRVSVEVTAVSDLIESPHGHVGVVRPERVRTGVVPAGTIAVRGSELWQQQVGDRLLVDGTFVPSSFRVGRWRVGGTIDATSAVRLDGPEAWHLRVANAIRGRVQRVIGGQESDEAALVSGFLIGDTSGLSDVAEESMRRAGLTHYVAVSGSNVALFLMMWWLVLAPFRPSGPARVAAGIAALLVFAAATRWEPSVIRASVAAGVVLVARGIGVPMSAWSTLGVAVGLCLTFAGELSHNVGFQLSVLAAAGVLAGASLWSFRPRWVSAALSAGVAAQVAVAPVLVGTFGTVPMLAPIANVLAAPLVVAATTSGIAGVATGLGPLVAIAEIGAGAVLAVAEVAAPWPQLGWAQLGAVAGGIGLVRAVGRSLVVPAVAAAIAIAVWPVTATPRHLPAAVFLDVGQGDATLLIDEGFVALVDGGPDPAVLDRKLAEYGVAAIDVIVASHVHADHVGGLEAAVGRRPVGVVLADFRNHTTTAAEWLQAATSSAGVAMRVPEVGMVFGTPRLRIEVLGPARRYASPNDESVVLGVRLGERHLLLAGDMETHAQADLSIPGVDVLKVPHQGAATSSPGWLADHAGEIAVVSVGPNDFGHPSPMVLDVLERAGSSIHRTDLDGDLVLAP